MSGSTFIANPKRRAAPLTSCLLLHFRSYLHGIAEREVDTSTQLVQVANSNLLVDPQLRVTVEKAKSQAKAAKTEEAEEASLPRNTRLSLTFRDVERVSKSVAAMMAYLQGGKR